MSKYYSITFGKNVMTQIKAPFTRETDKFLRAWALAESGNQTQNGAAWNPFNTTKKMPLSTNYNTNNGSPVQNYNTWISGASATATTLLNGHYAALLIALRAGSSALSMSNALVKSPWGTGTLVQTLLLQNSFADFLVGSCYPVPAVPYSHGFTDATKIVPGSTGPDVDELLRHLGNINKWYDSEDPYTNPVIKVISIQKANPELGAANGVVGPATYRFITGHA